jgi:hypothetical protein
MGQMLKLFLHLNFLELSLNFNEYISNLKLQINKKLYCISRLFFLSKSIKVQFFKTFILPYFDYCSTIYFYFPKSSIQKLSNTYNFCLQKLLNIKSKVISSSDFNVLNNHLESMNLNLFQHRVLYRFLTFSYKLVNQPSFPNELRCVIKFNHEKENSYNLRNKNQLSTLHNDKMSNYENSTFAYFFPKFINLLCVNELDFC